MKKETVMVRVEKKTAKKLKIYSAKKGKSMTVEATEAIKKHMGGGK